MQNKISNSIAIKFLKGLNFDFLKDLLLKKGNLLSLNPYFFIITAILNVGGKR